MPKKKKQQAKPSEPLKLTRWHIIAGVSIVVLSASIAVGLVSYFGGSKLSKNDPNLEAPSPLGPVPTAERSDAADLLSSKSFNDMTADELDIVKAGAAKAYENAQFRTTSSLAPLGVDIIRVDGVTRVARQYQVIASPGGASEVQQVLFFYCDDPSGKINAFRYATSSLGTQKGASQLPADQLPFGNTVSGLDWSKPEDLGYQTIEGRRVHGVAVPYTVPISSRVIRAENWFDIENARLIARKSVQTDGPDNVLRTFDWRLPQPILIPADQPPAPCTEALYNRAPSVRPPATAVPEATPGAAATAVVTP